MQPSRVSEGEKAAQTETENLSHILCRDLYLDSVIPCQYLQLVCEEDTEYVEIWAMGGPPSQLK